MSLQVLEDNWTLIISKVVEPLWRSKYKLAYENIKMDYDDFMSLAGIELTKAFKSFNPLKSNVFTYSTNVLVRKANTELRNANRERRRINILAESLQDKIMEEGNSTYEDVTENLFCNERDICIERAKLNVYSVLKPKEVGVVELSLLGFDTSSIARALKITTEDVAGIKKKISEDSKVKRALRMSGLIGGDENEV